MSKCLQANAQDCGTPEQGESSSAYGSSNAIGGYGNQALLAHMGEPTGGKEDLEATWGKQVAEEWNNHLSDYTFLSNSSLLRAHGLFFKLKDRVDNAQDAYKALDALMSASPSDSAGATLSKFKAVFDGVRALAPTVPVFAEFLAAYSDVLGVVATKLDEIAANIRDAEDGLWVLHPGAWPGGYALYEFMVPLMKAKGPIEVPASVVDWVKANHDSLTWVCGEEPPARTESLLGIDLLWPDSVDEEGLGQWFFRNRDAVKQFVYGDTKLEF